MLVQTLSFAKAHWCPPHPSPLRKTGGTSSPFSGGKNRGVGFWSQRAALDLMGKEEDRGSPIFIPSIWSICDSHEHSHRSALAEAGPAPRGKLVKTLSSKRDFRERSVRSVSHSQCSACFTPNQTMHKLCVSLLIWYSVGREEHTICNVIYFRPYVPFSLSRLRHTEPFYVAGVVTWQTTVNMTHRSWLTHTELCWMTKS